MKKLIVGIVVGVLISVPVSVAASQFNETPWAKSIYKFDKQEQTVHVFDDADNKCYIATGRWLSHTQSTAISCVKK